jgi:hypothetical protein
LEFRIIKHYVLEVENKGILLLVRYAAMVLFMPLSDGTAQRRAVGVRDRVLELSESIAEVRVLGYVDEGYSRRIVI